MRFNIGEKVIILERPCDFMFPIGTIGTFKASAPFDSFIVKAKKDYWYYQERQLKKIMLVANYKYKKDLKAAIGKQLSFTETSIFGKEYAENGLVCVVGPSATNRKWYAEVTMKNNLIEKVS